MVFQKVCGYCGDPVGNKPQIVKDKPACNDCAKELTTGTIPGPSKITGSGGSEGGRRLGRDVRSPDASSENAIRYLEEG